MYLEDVGGGFILLVREGEEYGRGRVSIKHPTSKRTGRASLDCGLWEWSTS